MFLEGTLLDLCIYSGDIREIPNEIVESFKVKFMARKTSEEMDKFMALPLKAQENLLVLDLIYNELVEVGGLARDHGDAFSDSSGRIHLDHFRNRMAEVLKANPTFTLSQLAWKLAHHYDWYSDPQKSLKD